MHTIQCEPRTGEISRAYIASAEGVDAIVRARMRESQKVLEAMYLGEYPSLVVLLPANATTDFTILYGECGLLKPEAFGIIDAEVALLYNDRMYELCCEPNRPDLAVFTGEGFLDVYMNVHRFACGVLFEVMNGEINASNNLAERSGIEGGGGVEERGADGALRSGAGSGMDTSGSEGAGSDLVAGGVNG